MSYSVKVILDGNSHEITVNEGETILEAAINADLDPPYACRVAASECTARAPTCKATSSELPSGGPSIFLSSARMWAITCSINEYSCNFADTSPYCPRFLQKPQVCTTHTIFVLTCNII